MNLGKEPVLDKGWVATISFSNTGKELQELQGFLGSIVDMKLIEIANATLMIKCPLFVQMNLNSYNLNVINASSGTIEAYTPSVGELKTGTNSQDLFLAKYFEETSESLIMSSKGLVEDGCDAFLAQSLMPVSVYNRIVVHGSLSQWVKFLKQNNLPTPIEAYRSKIRDILLAQWKNLDKLITGN